MADWITSSICKELRNDFTDFECNPPCSCFKCPFPDCIAPTHSNITKLETQFLKNGVGTKSKRKKKRRMQSD